MFIWIYYNGVCFVNEEFASFLLIKCYFSTCRRVIVVCFIDNFGSMLNSIEVAKVLSSVTFVRKKVMDAVSQGLLFLNTQEYTIGMTAKVEEMQGLIYNPLNI